MASTKDTRSYILVDDGMDSHPKIEPLTDGAFRLLFVCWFWCSRNKTDGLMPQASWCKRGTAKQRSELMSVGLAEAVDGGVQMHDYLDWQRSAQEIEDLKHKRSVAGRLGGKAKANAKHVAKQTGSKVVPPSPSPIPTEEVLRTSPPLVPPRGDAISQLRSLAFDEFWGAYPRKVGKRAARKAYDRAIKSATHQEILDGAMRYAADPNRIDEFTAHPTTWLNREGWNDDPLPSRKGRAGGLVKVNGQHLTPRNAELAALVEKYRRAERPAIGGSDDPS
jgi:hypothetical protein